MKKLFVGFFTLVCALVLAVPTLAASSDITLEYDLTYLGEHSVTVPTGTVVTVTYTLDNDTNDDPYTVSTIQNEIYWDHTFFELDEDSIALVSSDAGGDHVSSDRHHYMYFNSMTTRTYDGPQVMGTFDLKVIATEDGDSSWLLNTSCRATGDDGENYGKTDNDLLIIVGDDDAVYYDLSFETNGGSTIYSKAIKEGATVTTADYTTTRSGYTFEGWYSDAELTTPVTSFTMVGDTTIYADWEKESSGGDGGGGSTTTYYDIEVSYEGSGSVSPDGGDDATVTVSKYSNQTFTFTPASGYEVDAVYVDGVNVGTVVSYKFSSVSSDHTLHVVFDEDDGSSGASLNRDDHIAYMQGYTDGTFGPDRNITRAEATVMFSRLITETMDMDKDYEVNFSDMTGDEWYANAVGFMADYGIINGYTDGTFGGNDSITRAEFATIASRFDALVASDENLFSDVSESYWAYNYINSAATKGWIGGYTDGTFQPEWNISRSEAVTLVNRVLVRYADEDYVDANLDKLNTYSDVSESFWAYYNIMEASNGHDYDRKADGINEHWTGLK